jgi:hypothetical protein
MTQPGMDYYVGQMDMDGQKRFLYDNVDMGADEVFPIAGDIDADVNWNFIDFDAHRLKCGQ